jgi:hypothetical protein
MDASPLLIASFDVGDNLASFYEQHWARAEDCNLVAECGPALWAFAETHPMGAEHDQVDIFVDGVIDDIWPAASHPDFFLDRHARIDEPFDMGREFGLGLFAKRFVETFDLRIIDVLDAFDNVQERHAGTVLPSQFERHFDGGRVFGRKVKWQKEMLEG